MAINIKDLETEALIREGSRKAHQTLTEYIRNAVLAYRSMPAAHNQEIAQEKHSRVKAIRARTKQYKILDERSAEEILGFGDEGV